MPSLNILHKIKNIAIIVALGISSHEVYAQFLTPQKINLELSTQRPMTKQETLVFQKTVQANIQNKIEISDPSKTMPISVRLTFNKAGKVNSVTVHSKNINVAQYLSDIVYNSPSFIPDNDHVAPPVGISIIVNVPNNHQLS